LIAVKTRSKILTTRKALACVELWSEEIKWLLVFALGAALIAAVDPMAGVCTTVAVAVTIAVWVLVWREETGKPMLGMPSAQLVVSSNEDSLQVSRRWCVAWHLGRTPDPHSCQPEWQALKEP
jgi:hypothetical protein